jgi:hypothetical protein
MADILYHAFILKRVFRRQKDGKEKRIVAYGTEIERRPGENFSYSSISLRVMSRNCLKSINQRVNKPINVKILLINFATD